VALIGWALALVLIAYALRQTKGQLGERQVPLMGILAAFIFAAQAINFPVAAGTSGHLLGGALAAIVMGPWAAALIMTAVVAVQGLLFQDGGLLVMGWNILNMGVLTSFAGYTVYRLLVRLTGERMRARLLAAFAAGWISVEVGAAATAVELALSNTSPLQFALPAMVAVHALIGLGEGLITTGAISLLLIARPEILRLGDHAPGRGRASLIALGLGAALVLAFLSPFASPQPDGLEAVAAQGDFLELGQPPPFELLPDYQLPVVSDTTWTTILAVSFGTLAVFSVIWLLGRSAVRRESAGD
jgi:cobalt/nickel transport system permease protein